jgi:mRNA interferase MazF
LSRSKLRPAVVLANAGRGDWILCQVTSKPYGDPFSISLTDDSFAEGSLKAASFARPGKLFTAATSLIVNEVGLLKDEALRQIVDAVVGMLRPPEARQADEEEDGNGITSR